MADRLQEPFLIYWRYDAEERWMTAGLSPAPGQRSGERLPSKLYEFVDDDDVYSIFVTIEEGDMLVLPSPTP